MTDSQFLLIDQNLQNFGGHYWEYDTSLAKYFRARGHKVTLFTHRSASPELMCRDAEIVPWFRLTSADIYRPMLYRIASGWFSHIPRPVLVLIKKLYTGAKKLRHSVRGAAHKNQAVAKLLPFGAECVAAVQYCQAGGFDTLFIQTVHAEELRSLSEALAGISVQNCPRLLVMLRREPEEASMAKLRQALAPIDYLLGKKVFFFSDTPALSDSYQTIFGLNVTTAPIICDVSLIRSRLLAPRRKATRLVYLGGARQEKGFQHLPDLLEVLAQTYPEFHDLEFHFHSYVPPDLVENDVIAAIQVLKTKPKVFLYSQNLSQEAFVDLLMLGDIVLLPYDAARYRRRSSGILMQAMAAGKVAVVPADTWFAESAPAEAVQTFKPDAFAAAVRQVLNNYENKEKAARNYGESLDFSTILGSFYNCLMACDDTHMQPSNAQPVTKMSV